MEISKKQFALYTIILLIVAGSTTMAFAPPPEELVPLWDRLWQVAQPVSVDDNMESITVDTDSGALDVVGTMTISDGDGPLTIDGYVGLISSTEVSIAGPVSIDGSVLINDLDPVDVAVANTVTIYDGDDSISIDDKGGSITIDTDNGPVNVVGTITVNDGDGPLTVDGTVTVTDGDGPLTIDGYVGLISSTEVSIAGPVSIDGSVLINDLDPVDVAVANTVTIYDGGSSVTVDGTVSIGNTVTISDGSGPLTVDGTVNIVEPVSIDDNSGSITIDDGGSSITVDNGANPLIISDGSGPLTVDGTVIVTDGGGAVTVDGAVSIIGPVTIQGEISLDATELTLAPGTEVRIPGKVIVFRGDGVSDNNWHFSQTFDISGYKQLYYYVSYDGKFTLDELIVVTDGIYPLYMDSTSHNYDGNNIAQFNKAVTSNGLQLRYKNNLATPGTIHIWVYLSPV